MSIFGQNNAQRSGGQAARHGNRRELTPPIGGEPELSLQGPERIDAAQLAQSYANDLHTIVQVPELEVEQDRDLLRSRQRLMHQREQVRRQLQAILRRNGLHYKAETQQKKPLDESAPQLAGTNDCRPTGEPQVQPGTPVSPVARSLDRRCWFVSLPTDRIYR